MNRDAALKRLRRKLNAARKRAVYWSGRPDFSGRGFVPGRRGRTEMGHDAEYEMALDDMHSLAGFIEDITGKRPKVTDYRQEYRERFAKAQYGKPSA